MPGPPTDDASLTPGAPRSPVREIVRSGVLAVLLHPLASGTTVACLVVMLTPFLVGLGISRGAAEQTAVSIDSGADLYVTGIRYGRPAPVPLGAAAALAAIPGVQSVEPRIVGAVTLGTARASVVVVGVRSESLARAAEGLSIVEGRLPAAAYEVALGSELAAQLGLAPGAAIPPFYRNDRGEHVVRVTGVLRADLPAWQAHVMLTSLETAAEIFGEEGTATALLVRCPATYRDDVRSVILRMGTLGPADAPPVRPHVVTADDLSVLLARGTHTREGHLAILFALAFAVGVPLLLASTGLGLSERRRETALLKAVGWRTDEIVLRSLAESVLLAALGTSVSLLLAWVWVRVFGAAWMAGAMLPGAGVRPGFDVPFRLLPETALAGAAVALVVTSTGSLWSAWRASSVPPTEALR